MKKPVFVDFKVFMKGNRVRFGKLPADEKVRLERIAWRATDLIQDNDCRIHGDRYQSILVSVHDGQVNIQVNACCSEYAKDIRQLQWTKIANSFMAVSPGIGGDFYS